MRRRAARTGALLSAALIPFLEIFGVTVGLHMRQIAPQIESVQALPAFLHLYFPPALAGAAFATLLLAAVGTAAGLTLGTATTLRLDVLARLPLRRLSDLALYRLLTLAVLVLSLLLVLGNLGSAIIAWSFLSMGLRGATLLAVGTPFARGSRCYRTAEFVTTTALRGEEAKARVASSRSSMVSF